MSVLLTSTRKAMQAKMIAKKLREKKAKRYIVYAKTLLSSEMTAGPSAYIFSATYIEISSSICDGFIVVISLRLLCRLYSLFMMLE
jgi:hypothetical protein